LLMGMNLAEILRSSTGLCKFFILLLKA
jgi:hypothetical protein